MVFYYQERKKCPTKVMNNNNKDNILMENWLNIYKYSKFIIISKFSLINFEYNHFKMAKIHLHHQIH